MLYMRTSPILNHDRTTIVDKITLHRRWGGDTNPQVISYLEAIIPGAIRLGLDPWVMLAQFDLETGAGTSEWWRERRNPGGLGITGDPAQNAVSQTWATGADAAIGHLAHMVAYVWGEDWMDVWPEEWPDPIDADKRFFAPIRANYRARTLEDLNGTWAIDPQSNYGGKLAGRVNELRREASIPVINPAPGGVNPLPNEEEGMLLFGRVPKYGFVDRQFRMANKPEGKGWNNLGRRNPRGVVLHRMIGTLLGTDTYFADPDVLALTDYGVGVAAEDGSKAGHIYEWNDPFGFRSGWASGPVSAPYGDGKRFVEKYGINAVNRDLVSLEISGTRGDTPIDEVAWREIVHFCAWWADFLHVPYHQRMVPATGISLLYWHEEFTIGTGKTCPFDVVKTLTNRLYNEIAAFNRPYQTGEIVDPTVPPPSPPPPIPEPQYAPPVPIPALAQFSDMEADSMQAVVTTEGHEFVFVNDRVRSVRATPRLQHADAEANHIGPLIGVGEPFEVRWLFEARDGREYYLTPWWSRVLVEDTERMEDAA